MPEPGKYRARLSAIFNDAGVTGQSDVTFRIVVNGTIVGGSDNVTVQSASYQCFYQFEREFTWTTGTIIIQIARVTGSKSIAFSSGRTVFIDRVD